ncbi:response regulator transcription factor [Catenovulum sp. 2E275]|uniref:response regulator transcription factor n=1 Tax=Catenovulum sp. 2E275 TaxID=2980497 RepID=UPI0021D35019|nr:response regulator transcription factor [Catenovulum sp. 2E275]MCU4675337.1 response regulator transcription factor [Catenovulum sp. 2E275]
MNLLLVEDSHSLRRSLTTGLNNLGFTVDSTGDGSQGLSMALMGEYDLLILDIMLPGLDGLSLLKAIRRDNKNVRVLILSAKSQPEERVQGLLTGADDYLSKPFSFDELHARLLSLMRRGDLKNHSDIIRYQFLTIDLQLKTVKVNQLNIDLTPNEFKIIECLFSNQNQVITPEKLSTYLTGHYDSVSKNAIEAHISSARRKIKQAGEELPVITKRGFGYYVEKQ